MQPILHGLCVVLVSTLNLWAPGFGVDLPFRLYLACDTPKEADEALIAGKHSLETYKHEFAYNYVLANGFVDDQLPVVPPVKGCALAPMNGLALKLIDATEVHLSNGVIYRLAVAEVITSDPVHLGMLMKKEVLLRERLFAWDI